MGKANKFLDNLTSFGVGNLVDEMAEDQEKIIEAVTESGKSGSLTLKLSYKRNGENQIIVNADLSPKIPRKAVAQVSMFRDKDNQLHEENPDQLAFDSENLIQLPKKEAINT